MDKQIIEMCYLATLLVFMYKIPRFLREVIRHPASKLIFVAKIILTYIYHGRNCAIISALIFIIILFHSYDGKIEGFSEGLEEVDTKSATKTNKKTNEATKVTSRKNIVDEERNRIKKAFLSALEGKKQISRGQKKVNTSSTSQEKREKMKENEELEKAKEEYRNILNQQ
tara:strand:+ start:542 stop:1051 length:510 start_codon:yes stop_codon:yes gene_type:complete